VSALNLLMRADCTKRRFALSSKLLTKNEIHEAANELCEEDRVGLIVDLLDPVGVSRHEVDDAEVLRRKAEWNAGEVEGVSWEEVKLRTNMKNLVIPRKWLKIREEMLLKPRFSFTLRVS